MTPIFIKIKIPTSTSKRLLRLTMVICNNIFFFLLKKKGKELLYRWRLHPSHFKGSSSFAKQSKIKVKATAPTPQAPPLFKVLDSSLIDHFFLQIALCHFSLSLFRMLSLRVFIYLPFSIGGVKMCALVPYIE